ncbi:MAG: lamin tail domain-containing protein, partial [Nanoarchaeota archaeon]|nr:lamin tail domain-containing protein [Nanoarchaeota archaeon]
MENKMLEIFYFIFVLLISIALGQKILKLMGIKLPDLEGFIFSLPLGLAILAYTTFFLGVIGLLYKSIFISILLLLFILLIKDIIKIILILFQSAKNLKNIIKKLRFNFFTFLLLFLLLFVVLNFIISFSPPWNVDALSYHLAVPKIYIENHQIIYLPYNYFSNFPSLVDFINLIGLLLQNGILSNLFAYALSVTLVLAIYSFCKKFFNTRIAILASLIFYSFPVVIEFVSTAYIDIQVALFIFLSIYSLFMYFTLKKNQLLILSSIFIGLGIASKIFAVIAFIGILILLIYTLFLRLAKNKLNFQNIFFKVLVFSLIVFIILMPWLIKSYFFTGNPVWPFFNDFFDGKYWDKEHQEYYSIRQLGRELSIINYIRLPWDINVQTQTDQLRRNVAEGELIGPFFMAFLPLYFFLRKNKIVNILFFLLFVYVTMWFFLSSIVRQILFAVPLIAIISSYVIIELFKNNYLSKILKILLIFTFGFSLLVWVGGNTKDLVVAIGLETEESFYSRYVSMYEPSKFINSNLPEDSRILLFTEWKGISNSNEIKLDLTQDTLLDPKFDIDQSSNILPKHINSDTTLLQVHSPYLAIHDLIVDSNITLVLENGVEILMSDSTNVIVQGRMIANGTSEEPVSFRSNPEQAARYPWFNPEQRWGAVNFHNATDTSLIMNILVANTSFGKDRTKHLGAISIFNSAVDIDGLTVEDVYQPLYAEGGGIWIRNSRLTTTITGDIINIKSADTALVENCTLRGNNAEDTDAIDYDQISNGAITGNKIYGFTGSNSDGIDLGEGCVDIFIANNIISNCSDKGISIGQGSTAIVEHNIISYCAQGIGIKDMGSYADVDHTTFHGNGLAIACFEKNPGIGGAKIDVENSILSNSVTSAFWEDHLSEVNISYSLSNTGFLTGNGNLNDDPQYRNAGIANYELSSSSPCIDAGNPESPKDTDNSVTDMGAYLTYQGNVNTIIINEVNYNSIYTMESGDWIELYNYGDEAVDLGGWVLSTYQSEEEYRIEDLTLGAGKYHVLSGDTDLFYSIFPEVTNYSGNVSINIKPNDQLLLLDEEIQMVNALTYKNDGPWPQQADGLGVSLELDDPDLDNNDPFNWHDSYVVNGTPGEKNSEPVIYSELVINELLAINSLIHKDEKGEYDDWIEVYNPGSEPVNIGGLFLTDTAAQKDLWQISRAYPDSTTIEPGGYLLLWADNSVEQGILHLG